MENTAMNLKTPEEIIKGLKNKYLSVEDNVYYIDRYFVAASVVKWIFQTTKSNEERLAYLMQIERHMIGEIEFYWQDDVIKIKPGKQRKGKS